MTVCHYARKGRYIGSHWPALSLIETEWTESWRERIMGRKEQNRKLKSASIVMLPVLSFSLRLENFCFQLSVFSPGPAFNGG